MLPKLSDRAAQRCTSHIRKHYPDWKQAEIREQGGEALDAMNAFIGRCKAHLSGLRGKIGEGERPDIDRGWPALNAAPEPDLKPETVIQEVKVPDPETIARLEEVESKLTAAQAELAKRELTDSMVEDEGYRFGTSFLQSERLEGEDLAATDERLRALYTNLIERKPLSGSDDALYKRLHNNLVGLKG